MNYLALMIKTNSIYERYLLQKNNLIKVVSVFYITT